MPISLQEARDRHAGCAVYKELRASDRDDYLDLPDDAILLKYRIVAGTNMDEDFALTMATAAASVTAGAPDGEETPEEMGARLAAELSQRTAEAFVRTVVSWDFSFEPGGPPIPITVEALRQQVPAAIQQDCLNAITLHRKPGKNAKRR